MKRIIQSGSVPGVEERLRALFIRGLNGDAVAYRAFLDDLTGHLRGFLRKRIYYLQDDIEDVVQEILLAVHNSRHTYRPDEPLTAWVHGIARYKLMDFFRARSRREALNDPLDERSRSSRPRMKNPPMPNAMSASCSNNCRTVTGCRSFT